jgi:hypothetical protein
VLHPFEAGESCRDGSHGGHRSPEQNYLHAIVVIEVNVRGCNYVVMCLMLHVGQLFFQIALVVIVHQREDPEGFGLRILNPFLYKARTDQIPERFRSGTVTGLGDESVEFFEKIGIN